jgi:hypothetical protein
MVDPQITVLKADDVFGGIIGKYFIDRNPYTMQAKAIAVVSDNILGFTCFVVYSLNR